MRLPAPHSGAATYTYSSGSAQFKKRRRSCMSKCLRAEVLFDCPLRTPAQLPISTQVAQAGLGNADAVQVVRGIQTVRGFEAREGFRAAFPEGRCDQS